MSATIARRRRRVFIIDDHPIVREWLTNIIDHEHDLVVCGQSAGREGSIDAMEKKGADVAIVDLSLRDCSGFDLIADIKHSLPDVSVIVLTMYDSSLYIRRALNAGASGYVVKHETTRKICSAIRSVLKGIPYVSHEAASSPASATTLLPPNIPILSTRELEIFNSLGLGHSTREIADALGLSIKTVQVHCGHIREKLGIHGHTELISAAVRWNERHESGRN